MSTWMAAAYQPGTVAAWAQDISDRSREILQSRWLTEDKVTLHDLANKFGVSAERIRQIENNAIKKLRNAMAPA